ncbi:MAG: cellulase family glycosylhydrolase [Melioribacteraceae bacterium]|nr:cellulase family glycosylhydrolase [Melioribacteraceae bacterium]MCF8263905.1 cellulase family glycosylhydrolase [Melioribacteraceae bacterium]MCF8430310.1 cellulase family glycosylhydrolase [Melioribacteraceae bacterium]
MRKLLLMFLAINLSLSAQELPFTKGFNLSGWFQTSSATQIQLSKFSKEKFAKIQAMGIDHFRLPINLHAMTDGSPNYNIDPLFFNLLHEVINWTEELGLHLILDNHTFDPAVSTTTDIEEPLVKVWKQMAAEFKNRSNLIYYEILNEPHGIGDNEWNTIQKNVIDSIRTIDDFHTIIVGPAGWNSYNNLKFMPEYADTNLIYTFHFYDPFLFTHQGASWTDPSLVNLSGVPFPYKASEMPQVPADLQGTWVQGSLNSSYQNDGTIQAVRNLLDIAANFKNERNVPIFCGEFGVYIRNAEKDDRTLWHSIVRSYLESLGIGWSLWEYDSGFGVFEEGSNKMIDHDLNVFLTNALGLTAPPQSEFIIKPDTVGFHLYDDFIGENVFESSSAGSGIINFYSEDAGSGIYSIHCANLGQYNNVGFDFSPNKDLSYMAANGFNFEMKVKGDSPGALFDIRVIDTKVDADDHPWRMKVTIDENMVIWDGSWQTLRIPLTTFTEGGSWDDAWFEPIGEFDWTAVDRFEIVAEHHSFAGKQFWFDDIKIVNPFAVGIEENKNQPNSIKLYQNYPNPFNPATKIRYSVPENFESNITLKIYDALGNEIKTLVNEPQSRGEHEIMFDASELTAGIYFFKLSANNFYEVRKMTFLK